MTSRNILGGGIWPAVNNLFRVRLRQPGYPFSKSGTLPEHIQMGIVSRGYPPGLLIGICLGTQMNTEYIYSRGPLAAENNFFEFDIAVHLTFDHLITRHPCPNDNYLHNQVLYVQCKGSAGKDTRDACKSKQEMKSKCYLQRVYCAKVPFPSKIQSQ